MPKNAAKNRWYEVKLYDGNELMKDLVPHGINQRALSF